MLTVKARKECGAREWREGSSFYRPPVGRGVNRQPDLDVSPLPEPCPLAFHSIGPASIYIALRDPAPWNPRSGETAQRPTGPLVSQPKQYCISSLG